MTVQELIDKLQSIEDKSVAVAVPSTEYDENYEVSDALEAGSYFANRHNYVDKKCIVFKSWINVTYS